MRRRTKEQPRRDIRVTSQLQPDGQMLIGVSKGGCTGTGEIMYRLEPEKLAGALEDRKELAVIVNNLGLLVLAQLCRFNLAESLDGLTERVAAWGGISVPKPTPQDALRIAQLALHRNHGQEATPGSGPAEADCECRGTVHQTVCADVAKCGFCSAEEAHERRREGSATSEVREPAGATPASPGAGQ